MDEGSGGALGVGGAAVGMLAADGGGAEHLVSRVGSTRGGLLLDVGDHREGALSPGFLGEVLPAGERREAEGFERRVLEAVEVLPSPSGGVLLGAIEPVALEIDSVGERPGAMDSGPIPGTFRQSRILEGPMGTERGSARGLRAAGASAGTPLGASSGPWVYTDTWSRY